MQTQARRGEVLRIFDVMAQGGYLDRTARSVEVRMGVYSPGQRIFALVKLFFESAPTSAVILRPSVHAVAASAEHGTVAAWTAALLHLSWFALAAGALSWPLRTLYDRFKGAPPAPAAPPTPRPPRERLLDPPAVHVLDALLAVAQAATAGAYVVALAVMARLPSAEDVGAAAFNRLYQDVGADARILLTAKEDLATDGEPVWQAGTGDTMIDAGAASGATPGQQEPACGVLQPTQLWAMPVWALPSSTQGIHAFGRDLVCSVRNKFYMCCRDAQFVYGFVLKIPCAVRMLWGWGWYCGCVSPMYNRRGCLLFLVARPVSG